MPDKAPTSCPEAAVAAAGYAVCLRDLDAIGDNREQFTETVLDLLGQRVKYEEIYLHDYQTVAEAAEQPEMIHLNSTESAPS